MASLTTHVLDTTHGRPASGLLVGLFRLSGNERAALVSVKTNQDGRCAKPLLDDQNGLVGLFELDFHVAAYFRESGLALSEPPFLDVVTVRFGMGSEGRYHVPLLVSPYGYSTYRGS